jgi:hypothetical protein
MFIIPFIHRTKQLSNMTIHIFQILTIGGTTLWKENPIASLETDILHPNGIYLDQPLIKRKDVMLCSVDPKKTDMNDFYQWNELPKESDTFCWRTFYTFGDKIPNDTNYHNWLPVPSQERMEPYLCEEVFDMIMKA